MTPVLTYVQGGVIISCFHPLKAWPIGISDSTGKIQYKITGFGVDHLDVVDSKFVCSGVPIKSSLASRTIREFIQIPCGNCVGCRLDYSRAWADRCLLELKDHESAFFLTLTYDDDHLPRSIYVDDGTGEAFDSLTLVKRDLQLFHKRLRKVLDYPIRYFACGEYGDQTFRPHYHDIVFGLKLRDLKFYKKSKQGYNYYTSEFLNRIWQNGYVIVGQVNWDSCAYTARYVMKKLKGEASSFYERHNIEPPFVVMSRKPGIARSFYEQHPELFDHPCVYISTDDGSHAMYPSKYFKSLLEFDDPEKYLEIKESGKRTAELKQEAMLFQTDLDYLAQLEVEEQALVAKLQALPRKEL